MINRLALSGRMRAGKDHVAKTCGYKIVSFSQPIYWLLEAYCGTSDKRYPGIREMMQKVGQWGWGSVSQQYPITFERIGFTNWVRFKLHDYHGAYPSLSGINWFQYGNQKDFWVRILLDRVAKLSPTEKVAVVNVRFDHELAPLRDAGFSHYHVYCEESTRRSRFGDEPFNESEQLDESELFAVQQKVLLPDDRVIWNDHNPVPPGKAYITIGQFIELTR